MNPPACPLVCPGDVGEPEVRGDGAALRRAILHDSVPLDRVVPRYFEPPRLEEGVCLGSGVVRDPRVLQGLKSTPPRRLLKD